MAPATCGVAIDVPLRPSPCSPLSARAEKIVSPGAAISGFSAPSGRRGPRELNDDTVSTPAGSTLRSVLRSAAVNVTSTSPPVSAVLSVVPTACVVSIAGIVIEPSAPPIENGSPATWLAISAPTAPAICAFLTLTTKLHEPRSTSAILPENAPAAYGRQPFWLPPG